MQLQNNHALAASNTRSREDFQALNKAKHRYLQNLEVTRPDKDNLKKEAVKRPLLLKESGAPTAESVRTRHQRLAQDARQVLLVAARIHAVACKCQVGCGTRAVGSEGQAEPGQKVGS